METDVPAYLRDLEKVADRIAAMFEWEALAQQERGSRALPPFVLSYKNQQEIADLYSQFSFICMCLHMMLDDPKTNCSIPQREEWQRQLRKLECRVQDLATSDRFING
jgi:hypothetical protein